MMLSSLCVSVCVSPDPALLTELQTCILHSIKASVTQGGVARLRGSMTHMGDSSPLSIEGERGRGLSGTSLECIS